MSAKPRPTVLVVDDEPEVLQSVYDLFRRDYRVLTAERGQDAIRLLEQNDVHVVMSDQRMPEMSGVEFLERAKQMQPEATRLLFTGYADLRAVIEAINRGSVFRYITKPWDPDEFMTVMRQAVEHRDLLLERGRLVGELQEANARLTEANRLKTAFIEVASHELNTPVGIVLGMAELWKLMRPDAPAEDMAWIDRIHSSGKRLAGTVDRMLKLLYADRFDATLQVEDTALEPLIRQVVKDLKPYLDARRQQVELAIAPDLGSAKVDALKIADAVSNLLANAIKFTPDGGTIRIDAGPSPTDAESVRLAVTDQGSGIDPKAREHLFQPFFTGFDTLNHSSGDFQFGKRGMGLGLCLVKTFVELHGGRVELEDAANGGSTFFITLPRSPARASTGTDESATSLPRTGSSTPEPLRPASGSLS